jgi:ATP-dependent DNA ligase
LRSARNRQRSDTWQKLKLENQQEFVSGGFRPGSNGIDALLVGYYDATGLRFAQGAGWILALPTPRGLQGAEASPCR